MGKIAISLECNSIEEAKALLDFLAGYRKEAEDSNTDKNVRVEERKITAEDVNRCTKDVLEEISEPPKPVTAEDISRFAVSLLRQGKGAKIKELLNEYGAKAFTDLPKDKRALFLDALKRI